MTYNFTPRGVCSRAIDIEMDDATHVIKKVVFTAGCSGNTQGVAALATGMTAEDAIARIKGIRCGVRPTSCPDQLAQALEQMLAKL